MSDKTPGLEHYREKEHVSVSSLTGFARCPRLYFYSSGCRLRPRSTHPALSYGSAIHMGMPYAIRGQLEMAMVAFMKEWGLGDEENDTKRNSGRYADADLDSSRLQPTERKK